MFYVKFWNSCEVVHSKNIESNSHQINGIHSFIVSKFSKHETTQLQKYLGVKKILALNSFQFLRFLGEKSQSENLTINCHKNYCFQLKIRQKAILIVMQHKTTKTNEKVNNHSHLYYRHKRQHCIVMMHKGGEYLSSCNNHSERGIGTVFTTVTATQFIPCNRKAQEI